MAEKVNMPSQKKEKKKKEPKPKKPKKVKEPKPKKEKKPKEIDNTPPLPKGPVIAIVIMVASLFGLIIVGVIFLVISRISIWRRMRMEKDPLLRLFPSCRD